MPHPADVTAVIVLAAGLGTRMKSDKAKVLHLLGGRPMIQHVVKAAADVVGRNVVVVTGHQADKVADAASAVTNAEYAFQAEQLGTGHAVQCALPHLSEKVEEVVILCGDVPLLKGKTIQNLIDTHRKNAHDITVLAVKVGAPAGYGRLIIDSNGKVAKIVEEADASPAEKAVDIINSGIYCVRKQALETTLTELKSDNAQKEYYLTDIIEIGNRKQMVVGVQMCDNSNEVIGVNSPADLATAEQLLEKQQMKIS